jgi:TetR/AcrR family acrAB operon transcriptional repressor
MVRRTKADALATRNSLLDAAEHLFQAHGVSRTSLNEIATTAGTTRGAIYWHFKDKADLFKAMMERATLPLQTGFPNEEIPVTELPAPLHSLRAGLRNVLHQMATDDRLRRVFEVVTFQVEYNSDMTAVREWHLHMRNRHLALSMQILAEAADRAGLTLPLPLHSATLGLHFVMDGLKRNWLLDPTAFDLESVGEQTMDAYLKGLGFDLAAEPAQAPHGQAPAHASPA